MELSELKIKYPIGSEVDVLEDTIIKSKIYKKYSTGLVVGYDMDYFGDDYLEVKIINTEVTKLCYRRNCTINKKWLRNNIIDSIID